MTKAAEMSDCVVLYSGGTDSTCVAALMAERHARVHLLTFEESGTLGSPVPADNLEKLRRHYGRDKFIHHLFDVDPLVKRLSYERYPSQLCRHGLFLLSTPGFSSLSWHTRALAYCIDHGIRRAADGVTRELTHFPDHMNAVLERFRSLYASFDVAYENPVIDWEVPPQQEVLDRIIVGRHGYVLPEPRKGDKTTGEYLFERGILPHPNVKGSALDFGMQHACYPFVLFNILVFWVYLPFIGKDAYERRVLDLMEDKLQVVYSWLSEYRSIGRESRLAQLIKI